MEQSPGKALLKEAQLACAIVYGKGALMSRDQLLRLILDEGLPSRAERERILAERQEDNAES